MTRTEVKAVMGLTENIGCLKNGENWLLFGQSATFRLGWKVQVEGWLGIPHDATPMDEWPVRVRFDQDGRVDRIERGDEVEEAAK